MASSESDSTREKQLELHIQARVANELARLSERESQVLAGVEQRLASSAPADDAPGRDKVQAEVEALRQRLNAMPKIEQLDEQVEKARAGVVQCLRIK